MERESWIWGNMMYGEIQLFNSTPSLKATAPGKRNRGQDRQGSRSRQSGLCSGRTLLPLSVSSRIEGWQRDVGQRRGTSPPGVEPEPSWR